MQMLFVRFYVVVLTVIAVYGCLGLFTLYLYWRHRHEQYPTPSMDGQEWPRVTVQLPIYNERYVVERLIAAAVQLDYPSDKLEIQVLDDSTDETIQLTRHLVEHYRRQGVNIVLLHRELRKGYKAGALSEALTKTDSEFVAIFDADFCPSADFLRRTIPHFVNDRKVGMIQTRWDHLNPDESVLTGAQMLAIDKHFVVDQTVRFRANLFPKFNGSGGIWRRSCIDEAGGWHEDTVCEDLCLSTRAILGGAHFLVLPEISTPSELPNTVSAYKNQQARWAKGSLQCIFKYTARILGASDQTLASRIFAVLSMSTYLISPLVLLLLLMQLPILLFNIEFSTWIKVYSLIGIGHPILYVIAQNVLHGKRGWRNLRYMLPMFMIMVGIAPNQTRALLQVAFGRFFGADHAFVRTPKGRQGQSAYRLPFDWIAMVELFLVLYVIFTLVVAISMGHYSSVIYLLTNVGGLFYVLYEGAKEQMQLQKQGEQQHEQAMV